MSFVSQDPLDLIPLDSRIACLASGGVDSSVAIHLLCERGFRPDLYYIRIGMEDENGFIDCPAEEDIEMVELLARKYSLKFEVVDLHRDYWDRVVSYTIESVKAGLTPNPDVMCNKLIKFGVFDERYGSTYDYIATGHYATTHWIDGKTFLGTSPDPVKDQTDFLAQINFTQVSRLLFPIGRLLKSEVREIAERAHLVNAKRKDSQGICFLGKIHYNDFIERYLGTQSGPIIDLESGKVLGSHRGFWFHTIGQRKGLGLSGGPWYVVRKDIKRNIVFVSGGYDPKEQYGTEITTETMDFITESLWQGEEDRRTFEISFKIRHTPEFTLGEITKTDNGFKIVSQQPIQGIAPGQYLVLYDKDHRLCLGSGKIVAGK